MRRACRRRRRLHRWPPRRRPAQPGAHRPRGRREAAGGVVPSAPAGRQRRRRPLPARARHGADRRRARGLHARRRHGRHGLHREQQGAVHAHGAHQHPHAGGRQAARGRALLLLLLGLRLRRRQADRRRHHRAQGGRRLPGDARGRLRLGEAVHRADVPALPRGLRPHHPGRALPQRLRPERHLDRRPREGPGRDLPQGRDRGDHRRAHHPDLGRRRADPELHVRRRLRAAAAS